jgi:amino acid transporter
MPNALYVSCIGLLMCLFSFAGYEGGAHMAEETKNASSSAPKGIILTCIVTAITGLIYIAGILYACNNKIDEQFKGESDYPVVNVYIQSFTNRDGVHNKIGSVTMTSLLLVNLFCAGFSSMTVTSRIGFAMARDRAFPFSKVLHRVNSTTKAPDTMILLVFILDVLLCLLPLISQTAFEAIAGISAIGY